MNGSGLEQLLISSAFGLCWALLATFIAGLMGLFKMPLRLYEEQEYIDFPTVLWAFMIFVFTKLVLAPAFLVVGHYTFTKEVFDFDQFSNSPELQGWFSLMIVGLLAVAYSIYFFAFKRSALPIAWGKSRNPLKDIIIGVSAWLVAFPWIFTTNHFVDYITWHFYDGPALEQLAVQHLRAVTEFPVLFSLTAVSVLLIVPVIEELLFRGLLQSWLKKQVGTVAGIIITSIIFALVHFSDTQGIFNLSIIAALFVLALFLGFLRERQNSLIPCIALHSTVNAVSFFIILIQEKFHETFAIITPYFFSACCR